MISLGPRGLTGNVLRNGLRTRLRRGIGINPLEGFGSVRSSTLILAIQHGRQGRDGCRADPGQGLPCGGGGAVVNQGADQVGDGVLGRRTDLAERAGGLVPDAATRVPEALESAGTAGAASGPIMPRAVAAKIRT